MCRAARQAPHVLLRPVRGRSLLRPQLRDALFGRLLVLGVVDGEQSEAAQGPAPAPAAALPSVHVRRTASVAPSVRLCLVAKSEKFSVL